MVVSETTTIVETHLRGIGRFGATLLALSGNGVLSLLAVSLVMFIWYLSTSRCIN